MSKQLVVGACAAVVALAGCREGATAPTAARTPEARLDATAAARATPTPRVDPTVATVPGRLSDVAFAPRGAINPSDYACPLSTPVTDWYARQLTDVIDREPLTFDLVLGWLAGDVVATYETLLFASSGTPQRFGYVGEYTKAVTKAERDLERFWDIPSARIEVVALHGRALQDSARVAATYQRAFGAPADLAGAYAGTLRDALRVSRTLRGGDHPVFSFNAFAYSGDAATPPKIALGDGVLAAFDAVGLGDVAPQAVLAHEFAHHIQNANGYAADPVAKADDPAERTRYAELMADAYAAYYLTHSRGASMNAKRVELFVATYYQLGDCAFWSAGHHGTPNQRLAAARLGFSIADEAQKQGHILPSATFHARFVKAYPGLVAPDAR